jgi:hypothetical protein
MGTKEPQPVPEDILDRISRDFPVTKEADAAARYVKTLHNDSSGINVGPSQFCRAIIVLAGGDIAEFNRLSSIPEDPRDIIMDAERKLGNPRHYCIPPFTDK